MSEFLPTRYTFMSEFSAICLTFMSEFVPVPLFFGVGLSASRYQDDKEQSP